MADKKLAARIVNLREDVDMKQTELARRLGLDKSAMSKIESGDRKVSSDELQKISEIFDVSSDYLLGQTDKRHYYDLTEKDKKDVGLEVEEVLNGMTADINFYGEPMDDEGRAKLKASLQMALELAKQEAKKKFTPKKYRDGE
jgi:transcriptional regulator with XRE-family HTH domain